MIHLKDYILLPKTERQKHVDLTLDCLERGGNSTNHKGVLAQFMNSDIPSGRILLCHACNNNKCSEPRHLYWGTDKENIVEDGRAFGTWKTPWERRVEKHGYDEACKMNGRPGNTFGSGNKDKPKSEEHKKKISDSVIRKHKENQDAGINIATKSGRHREVDYNIIVALVKQKGFNDAATELNISVAALKGRYYNAVKALK